MDQSKSELKGSSSSENHRQDKVEWKRPLFLHYCFLLSQIIVPNCKYNEVE